MAVLSVTLVYLLSFHLVTGELENAALRKPTKVSSLYKFSCRSNNIVRSCQASNGVDGDKIANKGYNFHPMHTDSGQPSAWWTVNLERDVVDAEVKIYFRTDNTMRRNGVHLYTSQTSFSSYPGGQLCHEVTGSPDGSVIPDVYSVNCTGKWRYLMIYTDTSNDGDLSPMLDFIEVEILVCTNGTYGVDCSHSCSSRHCSDSSSQCDRFTWECVGGCDPGWTGDDCTQVCTNGTYGVDCNQSCSSRHCSDSSSPCDRFTGECVGGCDAGRTGDDCTQVCEAGSYGTSCIIRCGNCYWDLICDHVNGACAAGCKKGWTGNQCQQVILLTNISNQQSEGGACQAGTYGLGCALSCGHCDGSCEPVNGTCQNGCLEGYSGDRCNLLKRSDGPGSKVIAGMVGVAISLVSVACVTAFLVKSKRVVWVRANNPEGRQSSIKMSSKERDADKLQSSRRNTGSKDHGLKNSDHDTQAEDLYNPDEPTEPTAAAPYPEEDLYENV